MTPKEFMKQNRQAMIDDVKTLVNIRSVKDISAPGAPYGAGVREAQLAAMEICRREGFQVTDCDGKIAFAHFGSEERFLGVIAHLDVVPEGDGWNTPPYQCAERDGFLVGRGTSDDKGPFVMGLYAAKYLKESGAPLNYGIRLILGLDEESGMSDIRYYNRHFTQPVFTFTPDSDFPVCHGEKGVFSADLVAGAPAGSPLRKLCGGVASNVVPDSASAVLSRGTFERLNAVLPEHPGITLSAGGDTVTAAASGVTAHAGTPEGGVSAIHLLLCFLLSANVLDPAENAALSFFASVSGDLSGSELGIACDDKKFTPLTAIAGMIEKENGGIRMNINVRYPTAITPDDLENKINKAAASAGFTVENSSNSAPYYLSPELPHIRLLSGIYREITGSDEKPYVISGGTYARSMNNAVAFGPEFRRRKYPAWVGSAHMKNEAACIEDMLLAAEIYAETLVRLQHQKF